MTRVIAVDWSGKAKGAAESIWRAVVVDGHLVELENGLDRAEVTEWVVEYAQRHPRTVVGLDFAFSFPAWFCKRERWGSGHEIWDSMRVRADELLDTCESPFWGRAETKAQKLGHAFRQTELDVEGQPKSVFQIGGAGAVGTGSLRGMRHLAQLAEAGFATPSHASRKHSIPSSRSTSTRTNDLPSSSAHGHAAKTRSPPTGQTRLRCCWLQVDFSEPDQL